MGRHRVGATHTSVRDPLFGRGIRLTFGQLKHEGAGVSTGFLAMARELPGLVAVTVRLGRQAAPRALAAVLVAEFLGGVATVITLLSTYRVLVPLMTGGPSADRLMAAVPALLVMAGAAAAGSCARAVSKAAVSKLGPKIERLAYTRLLELSAAAELAALETSGFHNLVEAARQGTRAVSKAAVSKLGPKIERLAYTRLLELSAAAELAALETSGFHNLVEAARQGTRAARIVITQAAQLLAGLTTLVAVGSVLGVLHPLLLPLLLATVVPKGWSAIRAARARFTSAKRHMELSRQLEVLSSLLTGRDVAPEVRAHGAGRYLLGHYHRLSSVAEAEQARLGQEEARLALAGDAVSGAASAVTYAMLGLLLIAGTIPLAVAGAAVIAIRTAKAGLISLVMSINQVYEQGLFVLEWDRACEEATRRKMSSGQVELPPHPVEIRADNLTFVYAGQTRPALDRVDVAIRPGEIVALVGANGSGKSTLAKLLSGLYLPTAGSVRWGGVPIQHLRRQSVFDQVALVAQDFARWPTTARVNVALGRPEHADDRDRLWRAGVASGADAVVSTLADGWDTLLAREFMGGTELSGGQWQRIGLARAWFRDASVLVFDEPTSALDPKAEIEIFEQVAGLASNGRTVILVTHRLASVSRADRIYVFDAGRIVEHGRHDELMRAAGLYATMYQLQASQYANAEQPAHIP